MLDEHVTHTLLQRLAQVSLDGGQLPVLWQGERKLSHQPKHKADHTRQTRPKQEKQTINNLKTNNKSSNRYQTRFLAKRQIWWCSKQNIADFIKITLFGKKSCNFCWCNADRADGWQEPWGQHKQISKVQACCMNIWCNSNWVQNCITM